ncbi:serine/arginine repetitive matrix protein 1-like [Coturnix japonica]|uniref:serine/arginine repetitive matrix protein 1-like n=1 Tax=Coturnix japonica TaxID=93934 RepID=UPI0013A5C4D4|nr:serine/arginine repetitive matrix protein 1-like [Coturnix japonica]
MKARIVRNQRRGRTLEPGPPPGVSRTAPPGSPREGARHGSVQHSTARLGPARSPGPTTVPGAAPQPSPPRQHTPRPPPTVAVLSHPLRRGNACRRCPTQKLSTKYAIIIPPSPPRPQLARPGPNRRDATEEAAAAATRRPSRHGAPPPSTRRLRPTRGRMGRQSPGRVRFTVVATEGCWLG